MATVETIREAGPKYLALQHTLTETEWAVAALPQIADRLQKTEATTKVTRDNIRKFDKRSKDQLERFQKLKHHSVKQLWYRTVGKLEKKVDEEEKAWLKEYEQVQSAKVRLEEQEKEAAEAKRIHDDCVNAKKRNETAKKELATLLESLFAGPTPSFPNEDALEQELVAARQRLDDFRILTERQEYILRSLQRAHKFLLGSLQSLEDSLQYNTYDMFSRGSYADWMVQSALGQARDLATRAQFLVQEVRQIEPSIPHIGDVQIEQGNLVFNIMFDNIFTDMQMRQTIQRNLGKVRRATVVLQTQVLPEVGSKANGLAAQAESCQIEVRRLEVATWELRSRIITDIVGGGDTAASQASPHQTLGSTQVDPPTVPREPSPAYQPPPAPPTAVSLPAEESTDEPPPPYSVRAPRQT